MGEISYHPIALGDANFEVVRSMRDIPPAHYILKIKPVSLFLETLLEANEQKYESDVFEASGYKWKLALYPEGDEERNGNGHISLYLVIAETHGFPHCWEVNVNFKLFVFNQIQDKYLTIQDAFGKIRRFHRMKTEWGFAKLLPLDVFNDSANGFLVQDTCVFGAEVFVIDYTVKEDCLNLREGLDITHTWKIENFSSLEGEVHCSNAFAVENRKWKLRLHPKGCGRGKNKYLSLYLKLADWKSFPSGRKTFARYSLRLVNQLHGQHVELLDNTKCFSAPSFCWGRSSFLPLTDLHDPSKGFLVDDTLIAQFEVTVLSTVKSLLY